MTNPDDSSAGEEHEWDRPNRSLPPAETAPPIIVDLWSAPASAVTVDSDRLDDDLFGSWGARADSGAQPVNAGIPHAAKPPEPDRGLGSPGTDGGRPRRAVGGMALAIAVVILIGLGFAARQFDSPAGSEDGPSSSSTYPPLVGSPQPAPTTSAPSVVVADESPDCPMRLKSPQQAAEPSPSGRSHCFFIQ